MGTFACVFRGRPRPRLGTISSPVPAAASIAAASIAFALGLIVRLARAVIGMVEVSG